MSWLVVAADPPDSACTRVRPALHKLKLAKSILCCQVLPTFALWSPLLAARGQLLVRKLWTIIDTDQNLKVDSRQLHLEILAQWAAAASVQF